MELSFSQNFTLIALNAQDSLHLTTAKKVSLRCMAAAAIFELYLDHGFTMKEDVLTFAKKDLEHYSITLYQETVLKAILGRKENLSDTLPHYLAHVTKLSNKQLKKIELIFADSLKGTDALEEIPNLLGCDLEFMTAGISMKEYRSNAELFTRVTENLRAEILEDGNMTDETILMFWLLRESGCLYDIFSKEEFKRVVTRMNEIFECNYLAKQVFPINIHKSIEMLVKNFLTFKKQVMSTPTGTGVNFIFPVFQRSQSVFIDTEALFSNKEQRLIDVLARLKQNGHTFTVIREGEAPLIKIDNFLYEAIPTAKQYRFPVQGVRLRKYLLY
ncbi:hypothetical protein [Clostridium sp. CF012]|uniref:hypothetical protein n=1 Tax=Clostridium sp. CF012 TaxID=2843319 RepID=UPI001C0DB00A|nr:hypothetical protein [Clostridium sp. CF012]MBU3143821.1 hypothetical protein [Clostridium sp. CF012]